MELPTTEGISPLDTSRPSTGIMIRAFASEVPVRNLGSAIVTSIRSPRSGFAYAPAQVAVIALIAALYGAANGMVTIVRGIAVPEMVTRDAYKAVNGSLVSPMNVMQAVAPLSAAMIRRASGGYGAVLAAILVGSLTLCGGSGSPREKQSLGSTGIAAGRIIGSGLNILAPGRMCWASCDKGRGDRQ